MAPLGLGGGAGDLSDGAGDPGGSVLLSAIIRYTSLRTRPPVEGIYTGHGSPPKMLGTIIL